ncbi:MAG: DUF5667 domain-containing protein [Anaerolineales bacterium]|nr:DUF5667 domain-containing protein [Anaerolineales bacterium]
MMTNPEEKIDPRLEALLDELRDVPSRDPQLAARGRAHFLSQAVAIREQAVSPNPILRLREWINKIKQPKEFKMTTLVSVITILGLLMGSTGTVYASQSSLPNEMLYPIKLVSESLRLQFATDRQEELTLLLEYAQRRSNEISTLLKRGEIPPDSVILMLSRQTQQAMELANELDSNAMLQVQSVLGSQAQVMAQLQQHVSGDAATSVKQIILMLQDRLNLLQDRIRQQAGPKQDNDIPPTETQGANNSTPQDEMTPTNTGSHPRDETTPDTGNNVPSEEMTPSLGNPPLSPTATSGTANGQGQGNNGTGPPSPPRHP